MNNQIDIISIFLYLTFGNRKRNYFENMILEYRTLIINIFQSHRIHRSHAEGQLQLDHQRVEDVD